MCKYIMNVLYFLLTFFYLNNLTFSYTFISIHKEGKEKRKSKKNSAKTLLNNLTYS